MGTSIGFIVSYYQAGRFAATKDGKAYVAFSKEIPEQWEPLVGEEWVGGLFTDYPEAEERYKERVNAKEIEWGSGPLVSTTHNYTGHVLVPGAEAEDESFLIPGRLSLKRTDVPAHRKLRQLKQMLRLRTFWDLVFDLSTSERSAGRHSSYVVNVKAGRATTDDEKLIAVALAQQVAAQRVTDNSVQEIEGDAEAKAKAAEAPEGALSV